MNLSNYLINVHGDLCFFLMVIEWDVVEARGFAGGFMMIEWEINTISIGF